MSSPDLPPPQLIQTQREFEQILPKLERSGMLAVDTESNSLHAYQEQVCLIQFSTESEDMLLDPLALPDISRLGAVLADRRVEKIYHAAEYDIMTMRRDFAFDQHNLFDTYIAARTLGWKQSGLANLLEQVFDIKLAKRFQRSNWGKRPLPADMLDYARLDTHYLIDLRNHLAAQLQAAGRMEEAREAFAMQERAPAHDSSFDPEGFWQVGDARRLSGAQAAVLRQLYLWRNQEAQRRDVPVFRVLGNRAMLDLARQTPTSEAALVEGGAVPTAVARRYGEALVQAIGEGKSAEPPRRPKRNRTDDAVRDRYESLRNWRKQTARSRKVDSDIVLPREVLWSIAHENPTSRDELRPLMDGLNWRLERYGDSILKLLNSA